MKTSSLASLLFFISSFPHLIYSQINTSDYDLCKPFECGNITFSFPFSPESTFGLRPLSCGLPRYQIACDSSFKPTILLSGRLYQLKQLYLSAAFITLVDQKLITDLNPDSCDSLGNLSISTIDVAPLRLPSWGVNLTLFRCPAFNLSQEFLPTLVSNFSYTCRDGHSLHLSREVRRNETQFVPPRLSPVLTPSGCDFVSVPVSRDSLSNYGLLNSSVGANGMVLNGDMEKNRLIDVLSEGFPLEWPEISDCDNCEGKGGRCGYDINSGNVVCFFRGGSSQQARRKKSKWKLIVGVATGSSVILATLVFLLIFKYKKRTSLNFKASNFRKGRNAEFLKEYRSTVLTNYSYTDLKKMTGGFKDKLGEGGFGNVYKGKMPDGRPIAIKMLDKSNHDISHNFVNEVATIGRIHHVNVIGLLGFCWDGSKQALIYEFMPNGSLGDLLSKERASLSLDLGKLLEIAIGVAHGIEYLHNGCESRILHLDIKPQNVLLDQNLNPKISDFGLAKVYSRDRSAISMTNARGTIGYIAPEIFMRHIGNPSHKSDVYSYGMLVLDMVGGKKHVESEMSTSSEAYFPNWIYDKLMEEESMERIDSVVEEEVGIAKKLVMVGLWCIQVDPRDRPSMTRVVEMLNGRVESIEMPPKPFFFSPPRVHFEHEITYSGSDTGVLLSSLGGDLKKI